MTISEDEHITQDKTPKRNPAKKKTNIFFILLIICIVSDILFTSLNNIQLKRDYNNLSIELTKLRQQVGSQNLQDVTNQESVTRLNDRLNLFKKTLTSTLATRYYQSNDWLLQKARYYLELAAINNQWTDDPKTTSALITAADNLIKPIQTQDISDLRQALANERAALLATPNLDKTGILTKLQAINLLVDKLPARKFQHEIKNIANSPKPETNSWREGFQQSLAELNRLVIIRHQDGSIPPFLSNEYEAILRATIHLNLEEAAWATLTNQQDIYNLSLTNAKDNIVKLFLKNSPQATAILTQIEALSKESISPHQPIVMNSIELINQLISQNDAKKEVPGVPAS